MKIGIDISQSLFGAGVGRLTIELVRHLIEQDKTNEYVLFFSSMRGQLPDDIQKLGKHTHVKIKHYKLPPTLLDFIWNTLHIFPVELFIGKIDVFVASDWVQPPTRAKKVSIIHDLSIMLYPEEANSESKFSIKNFILTPNIVSVQKRRLKWVQKEVDRVIAVSEATKRDILHLLSIPQEKITVIHEGVS